MGQYAKAIADYDVAIRLDASKSNRWNNRCWARLMLGQLQDALPDCDRALKLVPSYGDALDGKGIIHLKLKQTDDALANFEVAVKSSARDAWALYGRGLAKRRKGNKSGGDADIAAAKTINANIATTFTNMGLQD